MTEASIDRSYAYTARPVVVTDATTNWTAMDTFSYAYLKELYRGQEADCQFFPYKTEFRSLQDVFNMSASRALLKAGTKPWYVGWLVLRYFIEQLITLLSKRYPNFYASCDTFE